MNHRNRRKGNAKRFLSILLTVILALSWMSGNALTLAVYAEGSTEGASTEEESTGEPDEGSGEGTPTEEENTGEPDEGSTEGTPTEEENTGESAEESLVEENILEEPVDAEEGLCPHHEQHTEDCGYPV